MSHIVRLVNIGIPIEDHTYSALCTYTVHRRALLRSYRDPLVKLARRRRSNDNTTVSSSSSPPPSASTLRQRVSFLHLAQPAVPTALGCRLNSQVSSLMFFMFFMFFPLHVLDARDFSFFSSPRASLCVFLVNPLHPAFLPGIQIQGRPARKLVS